MTPPPGVLPDDVIKDPNSQGLLAFLTLDPAMTSDQAQGYLRELSDFIRSLSEPDGQDGPAFTAVVGFGPTFFSQGGTPRFNLPPTSVPVGLKQPPALSGVNAPPIPTDIAVYAMSRQQALLAGLVRFLAPQPGAVSALRVEEGYQRKDGREQFGFPDGKRNLPPAVRPEVITTTEDVEPDSPPWAIGGTYFTYMKIQQHLDAPAGLGGDNAMEAAIGRRKVDGSRLDQPEAMNPLDEPDYSAAQQPALTSHIRKAGPRGTEQSDPGDVFLFRRGLPFTGAPDGHLVAGLQFVSFSRSLDFVDVVWNHWMMNPGFPADGTGIDQLFQPALTTVLASGFFFVPPDDSRFTGAGIFLGPEHALAHQAKVVVRKVILAQDGSVAIKPLKGFGFTVFDQASNTAVSSEFKTNSAGHAVSPELPTGKPLVLRETANPLGGLGLPTGPDVNFGPLDPSGPPPAIKFPNQFPAPHQPGYG